MDISDGGRHLYDLMIVLYEISYIVYESQTVTAKISYDLKLFCNDREN